MTNEQYLIVSYFAGAGGAVVAGAITGWVLLGPLRKAAARLVVGARRFLTRSLTIWLILAAMLGFLSVGYFGDCSHHTYKEIVEDYPWLVQKNHEQVERVFIYLTVATLIYSLALAVTLTWARKMPDPSAPDSGAECGDR